MAQLVLVRSNEREVFEQACHLLSRFAAACFAIAALGHFRAFLNHGWLPYRFAPLPVNTYWTSLTVHSVKALANVRAIVAEYPRRDSIAGISL